MYFEQRFMMSPWFIVTSILIYFCILLAIAWITSRKANNDSYFIGNRQSPWYVVAFGMVSDSLSGVTFISLPGTVVYGQFSYMQMVLGYIVGYYVISRVLLPVYYKLNLTSIYSYLQSRFGVNAQKTGSFYFLISRIIGAALRLFLAAGVIQLFVFDAWGIPFAITVALVIFLMLVYTYRGGIKTLVWTDALQSSFLILGVVLSIVFILSHLNWGISEAVTAIQESKMSQILFWDWKEKNFFLKQFLSGAFIAIVMTGLDQNMMQKNLSCRSLREAQTNLEVFSWVLVVVNLFFVSLGALLYIYAEKQGVTLATDPASGKIITDKVFPFLALNQLGGLAAIVFIIGLTAATFSSADSVLTTLTTSFGIDFLDLDNDAKYSEGKRTQLRHIIHISFALVLFLTIMACVNINRTSVLDAIFTVAAYTYGPLLGLFVFGLFTSYSVKDTWVPLVCLFPPLISYVLRENSEQWLFGYKFGYELLLINGLFTFIGLLLIRNGKQR